MSIAQCHTLFNYITEMKEAKMRFFLSAQVLFMAFIETIIGFKLTNFGGVD